MRCMETLPRLPAAGRGALPGAQLYLRLVFTEAPQGPPELDSVHAVSGVLTMGRAPTGAGDLLPMPQDGWASRSHARVEAAHGALVVEDLGSRNGTFVDGLRINARTPLGPGQVLQVGSALFVVGRRDPEDEGAEVPPSPADFACRGHEMQSLWVRAMKLAGSEASVLLLGEMGTGKTRLARLIHRFGERANGAFVAHNCSALPLNLEEATLFGVVAGFIPTVKAQEGLLTRAAGGTLFLDELADLPVPAQAKLLDAFDPTEPSYVPVGGARRLNTDCRLITATNRDVFRLARSGTLRQDLLSRLVVGQLTVPPLRRRREDLLFLFDEALSRAGVKSSPVRTVEVASALLLARWVENVRGLETLAQRVSLGEGLSPELVVSHAERGAATLPDGAPAHLRGAMGRAPIAAPPPPTTGPVWPPNSAELLELLSAHNWEIKSAAESIGRRRETLSRLVKSLWGGRDGMRMACRVYQASGKAPEGDNVARLHQAFCERPEDPAQEALRAAWRTGEPLP
jgi:DNA-binding NtrC family response regulator